MSSDQVRCDGSCEEHVGEVRRVHVEKWGEFRYCEEAIAEDRRRGLVVRNAEQAPTPSPTAHAAAAAFADGLPELAQENTR